MKFTSVVSALSLFVAATTASYMSPKKGDNWYAGKQTNIMWDKESVKGKGKMSMYLCHANAVDITEIITTIAISVDNTGSYSWTPSSSSIDVSVTTVTIVIVDSSHNYMISDNFYMYKGSDNNNNHDKGGNYHKGGNDHTSKTYNNYHNSTSTSTITKTLTYAKTSTVTLKGMTYTTESMVTETVTSCTTPVSTTSITYQVPPAAASTYMTQPLYTMSNTTTSTSPAPAAAESTGFFTTSGSAGTTTAAAAAASAFTGAASTFDRSFSLLAFVGVTVVASLL